MHSDKGVGVHQSYREEAKKGCDVLFHVSIKGREILIDGIPLHMSIKIFKNLEEFDLEELKEYVKKNDIVAPDPQSLTFKPIIFESEATKLKYYMLKIDGLAPKYKALYDKYNKVGNVYKQFMTHVTIDKEIYDDIKENGITADDIEFSHLILEEGAGNTFHDFGKSENIQVSIWGEVACGKLKIMPDIIRETINMHPSLKKKHGRASNLKGDDIRRYMEDHPELEDEIAKKHTKRLEHHFGQDKSKIKYAWENGIRDTYRKYKV
jgi:hypothetical protein